MPTLSDVYDGTFRAGGRTQGQKRNKRDSYLTKRVLLSGLEDGPTAASSTVGVEDMCATLGMGMRTGVPNRASMVGAGAEATTDQSPTSAPRNGDRRTGDPKRRPLGGVGAEEAKRGD